MNKENCALKLVDEIILYYDAWSKKHQITIFVLYIYIYIYIYVKIFCLNMYIYLEVTGSNILRYVRKLYIKRSDILFSRVRSFLNVFNP